MATKNARWKLTWATLALPLVVGCVSPRLVEDYKTEILGLREEKTKLKKENRDLKNQLVDYEVKLADANSKLVTASAIPASAPAPVEPAFDDRNLDELRELGIGVGRRNGMPVLTLPAAITFPSGRADLTSEGMKALKAVARTLTRDYADGAYWIEGHTDNDPIKRSKFPTNRELSVARATAVLHYLVEQCGVADDRCVVAGHGEYRPVDQNTSKTGKAANRRVEIVVHMGS